MGKVVLINSLMCSTLIYKMSVLPTMSNAQVTELEKTINSFLWKGRNKIPLNILQNSKINGGLNLTNVRARQKALRIQWINILEKNPILHYAYELLLPRERENIWLFNVHRRDCDKICKVDSFWRTVLYDWASVNFIEPQNYEECANQIIWYNSCIQCNNAFFHPCPELTGQIIRIAHIVKDNSFISHTEFDSKFGCKTN